MQCYIKCIAYMQFMTFNQHILYIVFFYVDFKLLNWTWMKKMYTNSWLMDYIYIVIIFTFLKLKYVFKNVHYMLHHLVKWTWYKLAVRNLMEFQYKLQHFCSVWSVCFASGKVIQSVLKNSMKSLLSTQTILLCYKNASNTI